MECHFFRTETLLAINREISDYRQEIKRCVEMRTWKNARVYRNGRCACMRYIQSSSPSPSLSVRNGVFSLSLFIFVFAAYIRRKAAELAPSLYKRNAERCAACTSSDCGIYYVHLLELKFQCTSHSKHQYSVRLSIRKLSTPSRSKSKNITPIFHWKKISPIKVL